MENIINIALKAEQEAQNIIKDALLVKAECEESIKNAGLVKDVYLKKAQETVDNYRKEKEASTSLIEKKIAAELEKKLEEMDESFASNADAWVSVLYDKATKL